ncbi:MAG: class I SAM-dependent methyltransferase [Bacteroidota bacterium]
MKKEKIAEFYDGYVRYQLDNAFNERHLALFARLKEMGLKPDSDVLEIGCGIGIITSMIAAYVKKGSVTALDISPRSIEVARERILHQSNITFIAADVLSHPFRGKQFDFITLFDVLEHIPMNEHAELFARIGLLMKPQTVLLINIPHPHAIAYDREHAPETLQAIDQALPADHIVKNGYQGGMNLVFFKTYSIWKENDYQLIAFNKETRFTNRRMADQRGLLEKAPRKLKTIKARALAKKLYRL